MKIENVLFCSGSWQERLKAGLIQSSLLLGQQIFYSHYTLDDVSCCRCSCLYLLRGQCRRTRMTLSLAAPLPAAMLIRMVAAPPRAAAPTDCRVPSAASLISHSVTYSVNHFR